MYDSLLLLTIFFCVTVCVVVVEDLSLSASLPRCAPSLRAFSPRAHAFAPRIRASFARAGGTTAVAVLALCPPAGQQLVPLMRCIDKSTNPTALYSTCVRCGNLPRSSVNLSCAPGLTLNVERSNSSIARMQNSRETCARILERAPGFEFEQC